MIMNILLDCTIYIMYINIFRLESYDRNDDFGRGDVDQAAYNMTLPDSSTFIDINSSSKVRAYILHTYPGPKLVQK